MNITILYPSQAYRLSPRADILRLVRLAQTRTFDCDVGVYSEEYTVIATDLGTDCEGNTKRKPSTFDRNKIKYNEPSAPKKSFHIQTMCIGKSRTANTATTIDNILTTFFVSRLYSGSINVPHSLHCWLFNSAPILKMMNRERWKVLAKAVTTALIEGVHVYIFTFYLANFF